MYIKARDKIIQVGDYYKNSIEIVVTGRTGEYGEAVYSTKVQTNITNEKPIVLLDLQGFWHYSSKRKGVIILTKKRL